MKLVSEPSTMDYKGKTYEVIHHHYLCETTNEQFTTCELDEMNLLELNKQVKLDFLEEFVKDNQLDELNKFLIDVANTNVGIRRKIITIEKYINNLKQIK